MKRSKYFFFFFVLAVLACGFFYAVSKTVFVEIPSPVSPLVFYANRQGVYFKTLFSRIMRSAQHSLLLYMYGLTDPELLSTLGDVARAGVHVDLVYDKKASCNVKKLLPDIVHARPFTGAGLMHQKLLIIDDQLVFLGSANMTTPSLHMHDNFVIGLHSPCLAEALKRGESYACDVIHDHFCEIWQLPDKKGLALRRLLGVIDSANSALFLAMFTLTHPDLIDALIRAHNRGVHVEVALDFYTSLGSSKAAAERLKQAGIFLYLSQGESLLHHKWVYVDRRILVAGSANWTRFAFAKNRDLFLIMDLPEAKIAWMDALCKTIRREALYE